MDNMDSTPYVGAARSPQWSGIRNKFLEGKVCGVCGGTEKLEAHHILPFHIDPANELNEDNLFPLCEGNNNINCHLVFGHFGNFCKKWNPNVISDAELFQPAIISKIQLS